MKFLSVVLINQMDMEKVYFKWMEKNIWSQTKRILGPKMTF